MKKLLVGLLVVASSVVLFANAPVMAKTSDKVESESTYTYDKCKKAIETERTDIYAIRHFKSSDSRARKEIYIEKAKEITKDCKTDYEKAEAVYKWVVRNMRYDKIHRGLEEFEENGYLSGICESFAGITETLCQAAGVPAKTVHGGAYGGAGDWGGHAWNRVYADNRWIHVDSTFKEFDLDLEEWSENHSLSVSVKELDKGVWDGVFRFIDYYTGELLYETKQYSYDELWSKDFPLKEVLTEKYDVKQLFYWNDNMESDDDEYILPLKKVKEKCRVTEKYMTLLVKQTLKDTCTITFDSKGGSKVKSVEVKTGSLYTQAVMEKPVKKGYEFKGWYLDSKCENKWIHDIVNKDYILYAKWEKPE